MSLYDSITKIKICYNLWKTGVSPEVIPAQLNIHRATVYRWIKQFQEIGFARFLQDYENAKKGHRKPTRTSQLVRHRIFEVRRKYHDCCGEKIKYFLWKDDQIEVSVSTIYRILGERLELSSKWKKKVSRGALVRGTSPRESLQTDTVDFGDIICLHLYRYLHQRGQCHSKNKTRFLGWPAGVERTAKLLQRN